MQVRDDMDEFVERFLGGGSMPLRATGNDVPTDVFHTDDSLVIRMDLPGIDPDRVEVTVQDNVLLINGSRPFPYESDKVRFVRRGTFYGDFTQRIALGKGLDVDKIDARFDAGVLELRVPYAEEIQPRRIAIDVTGSKRALSE
jgi:HSP20 family protein